MISLRFSPHTDMRSNHLDSASVDPSRRIDAPFQRGKPITILVDGQVVQAHAGESVMAVLLASGRICFRRTTRRKEPRGPYCGIGICFDCVMTVDDRLNVRTCQTPARAGMRVDTQDGETKRAEPR